METNTQSTGTGKPRHQVTILCDFDGTISPVDLSNYIFTRFASCGMFYAEQWEQELIGTREEITLTFADINAGPDEIAATLKEIPIDPTFQDLITFIRKNDIDLAVVSDGLDWPIKVVLEEHGIRDLPIYSNQVTFENNRPVCKFPWYDPSTPRSGVCKPLVVRRFREHSRWIVFVGDGRSDRDAVREADLVFAKDDLESYCRDQGIDALHFDTFADVCAQIIPWLEQVKNEPAAGELPVQ